MSVGSTMNYRGASIAREAAGLPPRSFEYVYYAQVFYSIMGPAVGISLNLLGVSVLALLTGLCVMRMREHTAELVRAVALPLACAVSFITVQVLAHGESLVGSPYVRAFVPWMLGLIVVQWCARRPGFLHRAAIAVFLIGAATVPYLKAFENAADRGRLESGISIGNPNDLGAWFGFCCVYFTVLGIETRRDWVRGIAFLLAGASVFIVGLTVSRGPLAAALVAIVFAFHRMLKRGFVPLLALAIAAWIAFATGFFDRATSLYAERGLEETGRLLVWPRAFERFVEAPWAGVGAAHVNTFLPEEGVAVSPHNSFLFIALASGLLPLLLFSAYWLQLFAKCFSDAFRAHADVSFHRSLLLYAFLISLNLNQPFMVLWMMVTLAAVVSVRPQPRGQRFPRIGAATMVQPHIDPRRPAAAGRARL